MYSLFAIVYQFSCSIILPVSLELRHEAINLLSFIPLRIDEYYRIVVNPVRDQVSKFPFYFFTDLFCFLSQIRSICLCDYTFLSCHIISVIYDR